MRRRTLPVTVASLAAASLAAASLAVGQAMAAPDGAVQIIVPFTPGTGMDVLARLAAPALRAALGVPVVVENRPGASGNLGTQAVAQAPPDGRTLLLTANALVMNPPLLRRPPYDPVRDFTPVIHLSDGALVLAVHPAVRAETPAALVALSAARGGGGIDYASPGGGTPQHLAMALFRLEAGQPPMTHVPYRGSAPAVQDLIAGRVAAMMLPLHTALPLAAQGRIRMLAIGSAGRAALAPFVPTMAECGYPGAAVALWYGVLGPAGLSPALVARLHGVLRGWLLRPETGEALRGQGMSPAPPADPAAFAALIAREAARWAQVIAATGITAD
jgi:tripartite-type tricarboxylate transporter receptor subunit TctC